MRENKYRGWHEGHPAKGKYEGIPAQMFYDTKPGEILSFLAQGQKIIPMQFTSLRDFFKNEIYVGDIVEFIGGTCSFLICGNYGQSHKVGTRLVVSNLQSGYTLQELRHLNESTPNLVGNVHNYDFWNHSRSLKIIGNIYENPELAE